MINAFEIEWLKIKRSAVKKVIVVFPILVAIIISLLFLLVSVGVSNSIISNYINYSCLSIFISPFHEFIYMLFILVFIVISSYYISRSVSKLQIRRILADGN